MADRGRDLEFSILTRTDQFDTARPASELEDLGRKAEQVTDKFRAFGDEAKRSSGRAGDSFGDLSADTSRLGARLDTGLSAVARASGKSFKKNLKSGIGDAIGSVDTSGGLKSIATSMLIGAPAAFGPVGLVIGNLLSGGITALLGSWSTAKEEIQKSASDLFDALVEGQGRVDQAFINTKLKELTKPGGAYDSLAQQAKAAKVNIQDLALAHAGDEAALGRVNAQLAANYAAINQSRDGTEVMTKAQLALRAPLDAVRNGLREQTTASDTAKAAWQRRKEVMERPIVAKFNGAQAAHDADNTRARMEAAARTPVVFTARLDTSAAYQKFRQMERDFANTQVRPRP